MRASLSELAPWAALVLAVGPAAARAGTCEDVTAMLAAGLSPAAVAATLREIEPVLPPAELDCLVARGAPEAVLAELRGRVRAAPAPVAGGAEVADGPAPAGPARPPPGLRPDELAALWRREAARMEAQVPDGALAVGLALGPGFGAGHFYAGRPGAGAALLVVEAAAVGCLIAGSQGSAPAAWVGLGLILPAKLIELPTAAAAARAARRRWLEGGG